MRYKNVFWDWNGTVIDDAAASLSAVNAMLADKGLAPITLERYRELIDVPIIRFYERVMDVSGETMETLAEKFNAYYEEFLPECPVRSETRSLLFKLSKLGVRQYVFSSSEKGIIESGIERYGLGGIFSEVLGASDRRVESKVERTAAFFARERLKASESVFIGDMVHDAETARAVGADCILIGGGHQSIRALAKSGAMVAADTASLAKLLAEL